MNLRQGNFRVTAQSSADITVAQHNELIQGRGLAFTQGNEKIWDNMLCTQNNYDCMTVLIPRLVDK